jgi:hypothetical protein
VYDDAFNEAVDESEIEDTLPVSNARKKICPELTDNGLLTIRDAERRLSVCDLQF